METVQARGASSLSRKEGLILLVRQYRPRLGELERRGESHQDYKTQLWKERVGHCHVLISIILVFTNSYFKDQVET